MHEAAADVKHEKCTREVARKRGSRRLLGAKVVLITSKLLLPWLPRHFLEVKKISDLSRLLPLCLLRRLLWQVDGETTL